MKVQWEDTDLRKGRRVWRDMECIIAQSDGTIAERLTAIVVLETGRIMFHGHDVDVAKYMTENDYRPCEEK